MSALIWKTYGKGKWGLRYTEWPEAGARLQGRGPGVSLEPASSAQVSPLADATTRGGGRASASRRIQGGSTPEHCAGPIGPPGGDIQRYAEKTALGHFVEQPLGVRRCSDFAVVMQHWPLQPSLQNTLLPNRSIRNNVTHHVGLSSRASERCWLAGWLAGGWS